MDPNGNHFSINVSFNDNAVRGFGPPLPRSFKPPGHGIRACGPFPSLLTAHQGLYSPFYEKRRYGLFWGLSGDSLHLFTNFLLGLSCVWGNSRARVFSIIRGNQTRLCRAWWFSRGVSLGRSKALASLVEVMGLQDESEKNFLFVSQCRAKKRGKEPDFRGVTPYLII